jgi:hypothetical protein
MTELSPGARLRSAVCSTEVVVVRAAAVDLRCGGHPMLPLDEDVHPDAGPSPLPAHAAGTLLGKRYADDTSGLELLCTKPGKGSLSLGDRPLELRVAKALPSSD